MRKILFILILGTVVSTLAFDFSHDFGIIVANDGVVSHRFWVYNDRNSSISILKVRPSCGCTATKYDSRTIQPGDSAFIDVDFNPAARYGRQNKSIYVTTTSGRFTLSVQATVAAADSTIRDFFPYDFNDLHLSADSISFTEVRRGDAPAQVIHMYNSSPDSIALTADAPSWTRIISERPTLPPYEEEPIVVQVLTARCPADTAATIAVAGAPIRVAVSYRK